MLTTVKRNGLSWNNIQKPTAKDWRFITDTLKIPDDLTVEMMEHLQQPRIEKNGNNLYFHTNVPLFNRLKQITEIGDLHIILTPNNLTTITFSQNIPVKSIFHRANKSESFARNLFSGDSSVLFLKFLLELFSLSFDKIKHINENIDWVKETVFDEYSTGDNVKEISKIKLDILMFQRVLGPQKNILESLSQDFSSFFDTDEKKLLLHKLIRTNIKVWNNVESAQRIIESLEITNNSIVSFRLNNTMRFLAAVSLITFALSVTLGIFSVIPFSSLAIAHYPETFWLIIFLLILVSLFSFWIFYKKRWF